MLAFRTVPLGVAGNGTNYGLEPAPLPAFSSERIWGPDWPVSLVNARVMTFSQQLTIM